MFGNGSWTSWTAPPFEPKRPSSSCEHVNQTIPPGPRSPEYLISFDHATTRWMDSERCFYQCYCCCWRHQLRQGDGKFIHENPKLPIPVITRRKYWAAHDLAKQTSVRARRHEVRSSIKSAIPTMLLTAPHLLERSYQFRIESCRTFHFPGGTQSTTNQFFHAAKRSARSGIRNRGREIYSFCLFVSAPGSLLWRLFACSDAFFGTRWTRLVLLKRPVRLRMSEMVPFRSENEEDGVRKRA